MLLLRLAPDMSPMQALFRTELFHTYLIRSNLKHIAEITWVKIATKLKRTVAYLEDVRCLSRSHGIKIISQREFIKLFGQKMFCSVFQLILLLSSKCWWNDNLSVFISMPKVIDKYVLEDKIGNGQFGEVYRGRHQDTLDVVAIKSIRRDMIKGNLHNIQANFMNCSKMRSKYSRPVITPTLSNCMLLRRHHITTILCLSIVMEAICWRKLKMMEKFQKYRLSDIFARY